jgi:Aerotolerance regulator N-terminal
MTFFAPAFLFGALAVAAGIVALHFIVTRQPPASILPTARFVPDSAATATARDTRPSDLLLMLLRVLVILAAGAALAKPILNPAKQSKVRVFLVDASRAVASSVEVTDSVRPLYRKGDEIIVFDSAARSLGSKAGDSLAAFHLSDTQGNLSAALIASLRAGSERGRGTDSLELVIVSPLVAEEYDAATDSIRKLWPGRARVIRVAARADSGNKVANGDLSIHGDTADPLLVTVSLAAKTRRTTSVRIVRSATITPDDSAWMTLPDHALVVWPASEKPRFSVARNTADRVGGVTAGEVRLLAAFDRRWVFSKDSLKGSRVIARWVDGDPAAIERKAGEGCIRSVAIPVTSVGDLVVRTDFVRLVEALSVRCGGQRFSAPLPSTIVASLTGRGPFVTGKAFPAREDLTSPLAPWFLAIALGAAIAELIVRGAGQRSGRNNDKAARATSASVVRS